MIRVVSVLALCWGQSSTAWAYCLTLIGVKPKIMNIVLGNLEIPHDLAVGAVIAERNFPVPVTGAREQVGTCLLWGYGTGRVRRGQAVPGYTGVYTTSIPGVGIRFSRYFEGNETLNYHYDRYYSAGAYMYQGTYIRVELLKIDEVTGSGPLDPGLYTTDGFDGSSGTYIETYVPADGITIITPTCSVDLGSRVIPVSMPQVAANAFRGVGSGSEPRNFGIRLNCRAGINQQTLVGLRFEGAQQASGMDGVLQISPGPEVATGVGLQLLDAKHTPIKLGEDIPVGPSKEGDYVVPMAARYVQTGPTVIAGQANSTATFTITYR